MPCCEPFKCVPSHLIYSLHAFVSVSVCLCVCVSVKAGENVCCLRNSRLVYGVGVMVFAYATNTRFSGFCSLIRTIFSVLVQFRNCCCCYYYYKTITFSMHTVDEQEKKIHCDSIYRRCNVSDSVSLFLFLTRSLIQCVQK